MANSSVCEITNHFDHWMKLSTRMLKEAIILILKLVTILHIIIHNKFNTECNFLILKRMLLTSSGKIQCKVLYTSFYTHKTYCTHDMHK